MKIIRFLKQSPDYQIHLAGKRVAHSLNQTLANLEINLTQSLILIALYFEKDHQASFEELTSAFELTKGGLSQHISQLEARGFIKRSQNKRDRRSFHVSLNANANVICNDLIKIFDSHQKKIESNFGESKLQSFLTTLKQISAS